MNNISKPVKDITGNVYGELKVTDFSHYKVQPSGQKKAQWHCQCSCGNSCIVAGGNLATGHTASCGCVQKERREQGYKKFVKSRQADGVTYNIGNTFGRLTVTGFSHWAKIGNGKANHAHWLCNCSCGNTCIKMGEYLNEGSSCGCWKSEKVSEARTTHGMTGSPTYRSWLKMKERCYLSSYVEQEYYQDKGVTVCDRWLNSFENFLEDMGERPEGTSLDRVNVNGNYEPSNCRWADNTIQSYNREDINRKNASGRTGVILNKNGSYKAQIGYYKTNIVLSYGTDFNTACALRREAELKYYGVTKD